MNSLVLWKLEKSTIILRLSKEYIPFGSSQIISLFGYIISFRFAMRKV